MTVLAWGVLPLGTGQLVLPDFFEEDDSPGLESGRLQEEDRAAEEAPGDIPGTQTMQEQQMRQMMQAMQGRASRNHAPREPDPAEGAGFLLQALDGGPPWLKGVLADAGGREHLQRLPNQTFVLETRAGALPVRLHEVEALQREADIFSVRFVSGDRAEGRIVTVYAEAEPGSDGLRALKLEGIRSIRIVPDESER